MDLQSAISATYWRDIALERLRMRRHAPITPAPYSWELNKRLLADSKIIWPSSYRWQPVAKWMEQIKLGLSAHVPVGSSDSLSREERNHVVQVVLQNGSSEMRLAFDCADSTQIDPSIAAGVDCYFKMQFLASGYENEKVVPAGFVSNDLSTYYYASALRGLQPSLRDDLYGRFGLKMGTEVRRKAIGILSNQSSFQFRGGLRRVRYSTYLPESYNAKLCLDLPGNGPFCFRLIDYFAMGCAIVSAKHPTKLHVDLEEGKHLVYCKPDLSDLVEVVEHTLQDQNLLLRLRKNSAEFFDRYLHCEQLAAYYLHTCFTRY